MVKIGIILNRKFLENQAKRLIKYLEQKAEVSFYIEDSYLLKSAPKNHFNEDLFFIKGKGDIILGLVKTIEEETSIPTINPFRGIWLAMNRFLNNVYLKKGGILVPENTLNPEKVDSPFKDFIIKNIIDQKSSDFNPSIEIIDGHIHVSDKRALLEVSGGEKSYHYLFYQNFIKSKWEYKIYGIGDKVFFYKQIPTIENPNKTHNKIKIERIPELEEYTIKAMNTLNLKVASVDFLKSESGQFYLTDINSGPNFNTIQNGPQILGDFLINQAKR